MNSAPAVILSRHERTRLEFLAMHTLSRRALKKRAQAILLCADGNTNLEVASEIGISNLTVGRWRRKFLVDRFKDFSVEHRGRPVRPVILTFTERRTLQSWLRSPSAAGLVIRARVILACAQGASNMAVAREIGVREQIVSRLRQRFLSGRLIGLRPGQRGRPVAPRTPSSHERPTLEEFQ
jgi:transposase